ncbi:MAG: GNAT family N-acetyltransferase [Mycoplasmatales bacterium]
MKEMTVENKQLVVEFVEKNIEKSLFIYGNLNGDDVLTKFLMRGEEIIGLFNLKSLKFMTFLVADDISKEELQLIFAEASKYPHIGGTCVNIDQTMIEQFYEIKNKEQQSEIATLVLNRNCKFTLSSEVSLLDSRSVSEVQEYTSAINQINEFDMYEFHDDDQQKIYVYKQAGKIIGGATLSAISDKTAVVIGVFVLAEYRNQGIARKLMMTLLTANNEQERLISIFFNNPIAKRLYLELGFEVKNKMTMLKRKECSKKDLTWKNWLLKNIVQLINRLFGILLMKIYKLVYMFVAQLMNLQRKQLC